MTDYNTAKAEIIRTINANLIRLEAALKTCKPTEMLFAWDNFWLAVKISNDGPQAVAPDRATIVRASDRRTFHNGAKQQAQIMPRRIVLENAIAMTRKALVSISA